MPFAPFFASAPFFTATDWLGEHSYFKSLTAARDYAAANGGAVHETTPGMVWRVTKSQVAA